MSSSSSPLTPSPHTIFFSILQRNFLYNGLFLALLFNIPTKMWKRFRKLYYYLFELQFYKNNFWQYVGKGKVPIHGLLQARLRIKETKRLVKWSSFLHACFLDQSLLVLFTFSPVDNLIFLSLWVGYLRNRGNPGIKQATCDLNWSKIDLTC